MKVTKNGTELFMATISSSISITVQWSTYLKRTKRPVPKRIHKACAVCTDKNIISEPIISF